ncbi:MAG: sensor histidine kinase [Acidimicrobiales bacterium]
MRGSLQRQLTLVLVAVALASVALVGVGVWSIAAVGARDDARALLADQIGAFEDLTDGSIVVRGRTPASVQRFARAFEVEELGFATLSDDGALSPVSGLPDSYALDLEPGQVDLLDQGEAVFVDQRRRVVAVQGIEILGARFSDQRTVIVLGDSVAPLSPQVRRWFFLAAVGVLALAAVAAAILARRLARPLRSIETTTERLAAGQLDARVDLEDHGDDEIARLARSVNQMAADLERSRALEQQFLLSVSHDLRTPMTAIRGYAEALRDGSVSGPDGVSAAAGVIERQAGRLDRLIRDLLDLARLDSRQFPIDRAPIDLRAVAEESVAAHAAVAEADGIALVAQTPTDAVVVDGDHDRLAQVVGNLLDNALKYAAGRVTVSVQRTGASAVLSVADDGPGIPADDLPHVFERLYVTQRAPRRAEQSSGLGLAIVRELVAAMGGTVEVGSPEGSGTAFTVTFPAGEASVSRPG